MIATLIRITLGIRRRFLIPKVRILALEKKIEGIHNYLFYNEPKILSLQTKLSQVRSMQEYEIPFKSQNPFVSVIIPTHTSPDVLWDRTIPSILNQSHKNFEVVISINSKNVCALQIATARTRDLNDSRIRIVVFEGPIPLQQFFIPLWENSGTLENNHGICNVKGEWIAIFSHDDKLEHNAIESLLVHARENYLEFCYGDFLWERDGSQERICSDPPVLTKFNFQGSILHAGLNFYDYSPSDAILGYPNDWGLLNRMIASGVRIGHLHEVTARYYPSAGN